MKAVMIKILISRAEEQNGRVQQQLGAQTLIRAFCHQYYKLLLHSPSHSLALSTTLRFVIPLSQSVELVQDALLRTPSPFASGAWWGAPASATDGVTGERPADWGAKRRRMSTSPTL